MLDLCLADSRILYFWHILESIHKFIIEPYVLQCLFVRGSNKKQRWGRIISQKDRIFHLLWQPSARGGNLTMWTLQERPSSPLQFGQEENIPGHSIEGRAYWFLLKIARMFPILTSRNRMMNIFKIVNINPACKRFKKAFLFSSVWRGTEYTWAPICKKSLLISFRSYQPT